MDKGDHRESEDTYMIKLCKVADANTCQRLNMVSLTVNSLVGYEGRSE